MTLLRSAGLLLLCAWLSGSTLGCSSDSDKPSGSGGNNNSGGSGSGNSSGGNGNSGGKPVHVPVAGMNNSGFPDDDGVYVGSTLDVDTALPELPLLTNVVARLNDDSTKIVFDPFEGAIDYRVYELPSDDQLDIRSDGQVVIAGGTYRCAGTRETPPVVVDDGEYIKSSAVRTMVDNQMVGGYLRTMDDATLGYVYTGPGDGLVPVYALGDANGTADVDCFFNRYQATRVKKYTTSEEERNELLSEAARDDGILFYVPAEASDTTRQVYEFTDAPGEPHETRFYFPEGPEADLHDDKISAFLVEKEAGANRLPLMRVFYGNACGASHDELAVGVERFNRIYKQGDKQPFWSLLWTGITGPTTLVVEALDNGCPQSGHLSTSSFPGFVTTFGDLRFVNEPFVTWDEAREASPTKELFVNGQYGPAFIWQAERLTNDMQPAASAAPMPKAIARAFVKVEPLPHREMDFFADFEPGTQLEPFVEAACSSEDCPASFRLESERFDLQWTEIQKNPDTDQHLALIDQVQGELWVTYADAGADTNGKFRLTSKQKANVEADKFLHVTMEVNSMSTARRYPQIIVSDQDAPIQFRLKNGRSLVIQPRGEVAEFSFPIHYQIEVCKDRLWDVNDQCPVYDLHRIPGKDGGDLRLAPNAEVGELTGADQRLTYDAYISTQRVYLFLDGKPFACAQLPADSAPSGPVTVTWGDVLYHSAVDTVFSYHAAHWQIHTQRHFDNLGFSSGVGEPGWDETRLPCVAPITL